MAHSLSILAILCKERQFISRNFNHLRILCPKTPGCTPLSSNCSREDSLFCRDRQLMSCHFNGLHTVALHTRGVPLQRFGITFGERILLGTMRERIKYRNHKRGEVSLVARNNSEPMYA